MISLAFEYGFGESSIGENVDQSQQLVGGFPEFAALGFEELLLRVFHWQTVPFEVSLRALHC